MVDAEKVLGGLKDFQRRTVEYVFGRMYGPENVDRFLVADEVGLGKTMVARGIVAKAVEQLSREPDKRIDIVYLCANRDIARQNMARLNLFGPDRVSQASRLTLLPLHLHHLQSGPNFVAFTPGTALNLRGATGTAEERALLYWMVGDVWGTSGAAPVNFFQGWVGNENWPDVISRMRDAIDGLEGGGIDRGIKRRFADELRKDKGLRSAFDQTLGDFQRQRKDPRRVPQDVRSARDLLIGRIRSCLARACLAALEPDLIILDEFQRFASLLGGALDGENEEMAELGQQFLAYEGAKILLLSATPYKAYTMAQEGEEDHHRDFLRTMAFLMKDDAQQVTALRSALAEFNASLFATGADAGLRLTKAKEGLEALLRRHVVRTERLGVTADRDGMVEERKMPACRLEPGDLRAFKALDALARTLEHRDVVEYWKSAPYVLNFMEKDGYILKEHLLARLEEEGGQGLQVVAQSRLDTASITRYAPIELQNARLRALIAETLERGAWKLLWLPPSLPYYRVPDSAYDAAHGEGLTKVLVFSSWKFVPRAIAAVVSYENERRIAALSEDVTEYQDLSSRLRRGLLRFSLDEKGAPRDLNHLLALYPSPLLCELIDPLEEAKAAGASDLSAEELQRRARSRLVEVLARDPGPGETEREDPHWYTALLLRADARVDQIDLKGWLHDSATLAGAQQEDDEGVTGNLRMHVDKLIALAASNDLGRHPADLADVLAKAALAAPPVVALRSLTRLARSAGVAGYPAWLLQAAAHIGNAFRGLFNQPDATVLTRGLYGGHEERYWEAMLDHCLAGNLQAVMDEHVHVLREALGVAHKPAQEAAERIAEEIVAALSLRAAVLRVDDFEVGETVRLSDKTFNFRCRGAVRFGDERTEDDKTETRADSLRIAFNSPFRPFVLASTAVGQEGLDFHQWCHAIFHWNLPANPVDFEQREGRVHRYKGHVIRRSVAASLGLAAIADQPIGTEPWAALFKIVCDRRAAHENDLVPFWVYNGDGSYKIRRYIPALPLSREQQLATRLRASLGAYRMVFGQPRQEDLLEYLKRVHGEKGIDPKVYAIDLAPR